MAMKDVSVVLAHGAWADGSSWARVITALKAEAVNVLAAPLPLTSLAEDVAALNRSLDRTEGPIVLAGHAYAGAVDSPGASRTSQGSGLCDRACSRRGREGRRRVLSPRTPSAGAKACTGQQRLDLAARRSLRDGVRAKRIRDDQAVLAAVQRPISVGCITVPVGRPLWKDVPSWFLVAEDDRMIVPETQRYMAERMKAKIKAHAVDHTPSVTAPRAVVDIIRDAIRSITGN